ncbi:MAG: hypothetical protein JWP89_3770 [Schlesneria sp.]|nr:hypothetical protein [Schlesneria sp.]
MNTVSIAPNWAMMSLLLITLTLGAIVGVAYRRRFGVNNPVGSVPRFINELGWLSAPAVVIATFAGMSAFQHTAISREENRSRTVTAPLSYQIPVVTKAVVPRSDDSRTKLASAKTLTQRPKWVDQQNVGDGTSERIVLASQQYTTQAEAEQQLFAEASELLMKDLQKLRPGTERPRNWAPTEDAIKRFMVKQRYVEAADHDFGNFVHPMYRVWWQTELSPEVRTEFLPEWRQGITVHRIRRVGIVASSLVLAASLIAIYRRLDVLTHGTRRLGLAVGSLAAVAACGLAIRFAFERWL